MASGRVSHPKGAKTVLSRLKRLYGAPEKQADDVEPIEQIVLAILTDNEPPSKSQAVLQKLKSYYVDFNELRVTRPAELATEMGSTITNSLSKAKRTLAVLKGIFDRENSFELEFLKSNSKQEIEEYFREIPGSDNYILASVILYCCKRQAFPLDEKMLQACEQLELVKGEVSLENMQAYLERQLRSADSYTFCSLLKKYSIEKMSSFKDKKKTKEKDTSKKKATTKKKTTTKNKTASKKKTATKNKTDSTKKKASNKKSTKAKSKSKK